MKEKIRLCYAHNGNMGDMLNVLLIQNYFGFKIQRSNSCTAEMIAIGSSLDKCMWSEFIPRAICQFFSGICSPKLYIWGTGYMNRREDRPFFKKDMYFCAVRGELSKRRVENMLGYPLDIPTGDGGILASLLLSEPPKRVYDVGIVAHFREQGEQVFQTLLRQFPNSTFIDVLDDPLQVVQKIGTCKHILSSALHGLIVADSLGIPNHHIVATNKLLGDGFKFDDYYSAYDLKHIFTSLDKSEIPNLDWIDEHYQLTTEMINQKKKMMIECFPFEIINKEHIKI